MKLTKEQEFLKEVFRKQGFFSTHTNKAICFIHQALPCIIEQRKTATETQWVLLLNNVPIYAKTTPYEVITCLKKGTKKHYRAKVFYERSEKAT